MPLKDSNIYVYSIPKEYVFIVKYTCMHVYIHMLCILYMMYINIGIYLYTYMHIEMEWDSYIWSAYNIVLIFKKRSKANMQNLASVMFEWLYRYHC